VDVLVVNAGSTSLKLHLVHGDQSRPVEDFVVADAVGHRVVHGGRRFAGPTLVDEEVEREIAALSVLAPLHNRRALEEIRRAREALPGVPQVAVFDTAFHRTMSEAASTYAIPERWREEWDVHRYGFHGISVQWAASQVEAERLVVCHLGGGCSVTAVRGGRSVDTTMGFSPLDGVPMATRSGSVDPAALVYLLREKHLSVDDLEHGLEQESGLLGLSAGGSGDVREASPLALDVFVHRVAGAVAAMSAACGGIDVLAFTGGIGENATDVRDRVVERVRFLGEFRVEIVPAREELVIAEETRRLLVRCECGRSDYAATVVTEGEPAPDFTLTSDAGESVSLSDFRGKPVVLYFYPKDDTPGCTAQACGIRDAYGEFERAGAVVLGVSPDSVKRHVKFREKYGLPFTLLADPEHEVAERYGVWGEKKFAGRQYMGINRSTFVIAPDGTVAKAMYDVKPAEHADDVLAVLAAA